jgi:xanthine/CO dehydrogenase XdhC/CoxF family maturation factor
MKEIRSILNAWRQIDFSKQKAALAMVVRTEGSSYRRMGARMLVLDDGQFVGGISGGCLEGDAKRRALKSIVSEKASTITYDTTQDDDHQIGVGLGCNGVIDVLFIPLNGEQDAISILKEVEHTREIKVLLTIVKAPDSNHEGKTFLFNGTSLPSEYNFPGDAEEQLREMIFNRKSGILQLPDHRIFIEVITPAIHLQIYGSNYDVYPITRIAQELGWDISLVGKPEKILKEIAPSTKIFSQYLENRPVRDQWSAVILMSHDLVTDKNNLKEILPSPVPYIALLGPAKRRDKLLEGIDIKEEWSDKIHGPAGLDIGAGNPEEIAISIVSEIIAFFAGRKGSSLKYLNGPIHEDNEL